MLAKFRKRRPPRCGVPEKRLEQHRFEKADVFRRCWSNFQVRLLCCLTTFGVDRAARLAANAAAQCELISLQVLERAHANTRHRPNARAGLAAKGRVGRLDGGQPRGPVHTVPDTIARYHNTLARWIAQLAKGGWPRPAAIRGDAMISWHGAIDHVWAGSPRTDARIEAPVLPDSGTQMRSGIGGARNVWRRPAEAGRYVTDAARAAAGTAAVTRSPTSSS